MHRVSGAVLAALIVCIGCGDGGGSSNDNSGPEPATPTPAATAAPTPTLQPTPVPTANAWSAGVREDPGVRRGIVLRSENGGATWTETLSLENALLEGISFADATRGWVVGTNALSRSDDSGLTWSSQRAAVPVDLFGLESVQALSRERVIAVGGGVPLQGTGNAPSLILRTENAGAAWTVAPIGTGGGGDPSRTRLSGVCITEAGIGLAVGSGTTTSLAVRTSDHGATWTDITTRVQGSSGGELFDVACLANEFWVVTNGETFVRYSADAGESWQDVLEVTLDTGLTGISAPAPGVAVAVGVDDRNQPLIIRTTNAGATWTRTPIEGLSENAFLTAVSFAGADDGTAVGESRALTGSVTALTETQGTTWTAGQPLEGPIRLFDVFRVNE